MTDKYN